MNEQTQIDLEVRVAFQEKAIEELREELFLQQGIVLKLENEIKRMSEQFKSILKGGENIGPANEKPPHY
jgi:uncharacterized coiled-coil protein SlyX